MKKIYLLLFLVLFLFSCQENGSENISTQEKDSKPQVKKEIDKPKETIPSKEEKNVSKTNTSDELEAQDIVSSEPDIVNFVGDYSCYIQDVFEENAKVFVLVDYFQTFHTKKECEELGLEIDEGSESCELNDSTKTYKLELKNDTKITFDGKEVSNKDFINLFKNNSISKEIPFYINTNSYFKILSLESKLL